MVTNYGEQMAQPSGTELVADTFPGPSSSEPRSLTVSGDKLFYIATTEAGTHLFVTDGSVSGTLQLTTESQSQHNSTTKTIFLFGTD